MATTLDAPGTTPLDEALHAVRHWQHDDTPLQLHPGDLGWNARTGPTTPVLRAWRRDGTLVALGMLDAPDLLRLALDPRALDDDHLAQQVLTDLDDADRGVLPAGTASLETPTGATIHDLALADGWDAGESWTPLRRDLSAPVEDPGLRVEIVDGTDVSVRTAVHRASFPGSTFTDEAWRVMAAGPAYAAARCLVGSTTTAPRSPRRRCGPQGPAGRGCWSRSACTTSTAGMDTAGRSASRARRCSAGSARPARSSAPRRPTPGRS